MAAKAKQADVEEQEEDDKPEGENEQPAAKSKFAFLKFKMPSMKWMIIGGAGLLVLVGGGGGAYFFLKGSAHKEPQVAAKPATFVDLPDVLVNLSNTGADRTQYLKVKVVGPEGEVSEGWKNRPMLGVWDTTTGKMLKEWRLPDLGAERVAFHPTWPVLAVVEPNGAMNSRLGLWDFAPEK